jgi:hypothetical protein
LRASVVFSSHPTWHCRHGNIALKAGTGRMPRYRMRET